MEKVQILLYALASFFSTENLPIVVKSAKIEINSVTKQIILHQNDIITIPQYADKASLALENVLKTQAFVEDLEPLTLTSKHFHEDDGKLNATIYFQYKELSDLRAISMYLNADKNTLSYPFMDSFEYTAPDAVFDERFLRFKVEDKISFEMAMKARPELQNTVSLLSDWKKVRTC